MLNAIEFIRHCNTLNDQIKFDPFAILEQVLYRNKFLKDADMAKAITRLFELGASIDASMVSTFKDTHHHHPQCQQLLDEVLDFEVKEPGFD